MSSYNPFSHGLWGNRLIVNRSLDNWREYGAATGSFEFKKDWNTFVLNRDARELALFKGPVSEKADFTFEHELGGNLQLSGPEMWDLHRTETKISGRELNAWKNGFVEAYSGDLEEHLSDLIPRELHGKLGVFCNTVTAIVRHLEYGGDDKDYGVSLGKKVQEVAKTHPKRAEIISRATREGKSEANQNWGWQLTGQYSLQHPWLSSPFRWEMDRFEEALYEKTYLDAYFSTLREHLEKFVPKKTWKNAFLICSLYDEMMFQKDSKKKYGSQSGWVHIRSRRDHDLRISEQRKEAAAKVYEEKSRPKVPTMGISDPSPKFGSHRMAITPGAQAAFEESGEQPQKYTDRHFSGDFGEVNGHHDVAENQKAMTTGRMVMSIYTLSTGVRFYIITDHGHVSTTILLPEEY